MIIHESLYLEYNVFCISKHLIPILLIENNQNSQNTTHTKSKGYFEVKTPARFLMNF